MSIIAYKLCRITKSGELTSLFINKTKRLPMNTWMEAELHPTKGFATRPYWHCVPTMYAPHLTTKGRVWVKVEIEDYVEIKRPSNHGGLWYLANRLKILEIMT